MDLRRIGIVLALSTLLAAGLAFATSREAARWAQTPPVPDSGAAKALFEKKCSVCHALERPLGKTKNRDGWTKTVKRMQQVNGCDISDEEAEAIIGYLAKVRGAFAS